MDDGSRIATLALGFPTVANKVWNLVVKDK
jgi:hypothetical protein